jgi:DNA-binding transcriptional LysR family regulator
LEADLGVLLFSRSRRGMRLTPEGDILYRSVTAGLTSIADTATTLRQQQGRRNVTVGATLGFSTFWLMPRLPGFRSANPNDRSAPGGVGCPGRSRRLSASTWRSAMATAIGRRSMPPASSAARVFPVVGTETCSKGKKLPLSLEDFRAMPLLESWNRQDPRWLELGGLARMTLPGAPRLPAARIRFNSYPLLVQAAVAGEGIGLGWRYFVDEFLHDGRLVRPVEEVMVTDFAFHLVEPIGARPRTATTLAAQLAARPRQGECRDGFALKLRLPIYHHRLSIIDNGAKSAEIALPRSTDATQSSEAHPCFPPFVPLKILRYGLSGKYPAERFIPPAQDLKKSYDVVIIGGGGHALACAYYLAKTHGITNVCILERGYLAGGNTARNTAIIRSNYLTPEGVRFYEQSLKLYREFSQELDFNILYSRTRPFHARPYRRRDAHQPLARRGQQALGVDSELIYPDQIAKLCPHLNMSDCGGALSDHGRALSSAGIDRAA